VPNCLLDFGGLLSNSEDPNIGSHRQFSRRGFAMSVTGTLAEQAASMLPSINKSARCLKTTAPRIEPLCPASI
jgi:hypothetical protein